MTDPPFGFGRPGDHGGSGDSGGTPGGGPLGPLGDPQQFADALRQFADLMSWQGGPVNWDLAKNVARQTVAAKGDPSILDVERQRVTDAIRVADLWLEDVTSFPTGIRAAQAWSRSEWVEATLPMRADDASRTVRAWPRPRAAPVTATTGPRPCAARRASARPGLAAGATAWLSLGRT